MSRYAAFAAEQRLEVDRKLMRVVAAYLSVSEKPSVFAFGSAVDLPASASSIAFAR